MNKKLRGVIVLIICIAVILCTGTSMIDEEEKLYQAINAPEDMIEYINNSFEQIISAVKDFSAFMNYSINYDALLVVGNPFMIFHPDLDVQDEVLYFPILNDESNSIQFIISITGVEDYYTYGICIDLVDVLNNASYASLSCVVYVYSYCVFVENENGEVFSNEYDPEKLTPSLAEQEFENLHYNDKNNLVIEKAYNLKKVIPVELSSEEQENLLIGSVTVKVTLKGPVGQYNNNMCWASTVASIANNFIAQAQANPYYVCDRLGIGYNSGGTINNMRSGLQLFNVNYIIRTSTLSSAQVKTNIDNSRPFGIVASRASNPNALGHAVTGHGYNASSSSNPVTNIHYWDSALSNGNGNYSSFNFKTSGSMTFTSIGVSYLWYNTLSNS